MKTLIYITLMSFFGYNISFAQETIVPLYQLGTYNEETNVQYYYQDLNNDLNKFTGTWIYNNENIQFTVKFYKITHYQSGGTYYDDIYAKIKYIDNGQIIYDNIDELNYQANDISGCNLINMNQISLVYRENNGISVTSIPRLVIKYVPCSSSTNDCEELIWENTYLKETADEPWPFLLPTDMVLTRE